MHLIRLALCLMAALLISTSSYAADKGGKQSKVAAPAAEQEFIPAAVTAPLIKGAYIGVNGGYQIGATELGLSDPPLSASADGLSSRGWTAGIQGGVDYRFPNTPFVLGVFGEWNPVGSADFNVSTSWSGTLVKASIDHEMKGGLRAGYVFNGGTMAYLGGFYSKADFNWNLDGTKGSNDLKGKGLVAGFEIPLTPNVSWGAQYSYSMYDTVSYDLGGSEKLTLDMDVHAVTARLNFRFGPSQ